MPFMHLIPQQEYYCTLFQPITYPNVIALEVADYTNVKLYSGSWSDWISYEENAVETVDE